MGSSHHHHRRGVALQLTLGANGLLLVAMVVGGALFSSLALLADAAHQATDVIGLFVAWLALRTARRSGSDRYTYGLQRIEVLGALVNAVLLVASASWIAVEAVRRWGATDDIDGPGVIVLAVVGLAVNGGGALMLSRHSGSSLNMRAAVVHLVADAAGSVIVLGVGLSVTLADWRWTDPVASLLLATMVLVTGWRLLTRTTSVLLEAAPHPGSATELAAAMSAHPDVEDVHHVHVWSLDSETAALTAHVVVDRTTLHEAQRVSRELERLLEDRGVEHSTLSLECHPCDTPLH